MINFPNCDGFYRFCNKDRFFATEPVKASQTQAHLPFDQIPTEKTLLVRIQIQYIKIV